MFGQGAIDPKLLSMPPKLFKVGQGTEDMMPISFPTPHALLQFSPLSKGWRGRESSSSTTSDRGEDSDDSNMAEDEEMRDTTNKLDDKNQSQAQEQAQSEQRNTIIPTHQSNPSTSAAALPAPPNPPPKPKKRKKKLDEDGNEINEPRYSYHKPTTQQGRQKELYGSKGKIYKGGKRLKIGSISLLHSHTNLSSRIEGNSV